VLGLTTAACLIRDTQVHVRRELTGPSRAPRRHRFVAMCQAGLVTKVADVVAWGLLPLYLIERGVGIATVAAIGALYPAVWGACQPLTGALSDRMGRSGLVTAGLLCQSTALLLLAAAGSVSAWVTGVAVLGVGTALAYPVLLAAAGDEVAPTRRASAIGLYRFWRDLGFVAGALAGGTLADAVGTPAALEALAGAAAASGLLAAAGMRLDHAILARAVGGTIVEPSE